MRNLETMPSIIRKIKIYNILDQYFENLFKENPLILIIENLEFIDQASISFLNSLITNHLNFRVMIIITSRTKLKFSLKKHCNYNQIQMRPFSLVEVELYTRLLLNIDNLSIKHENMLFDFLIKYSGGNPLLLEELCKIPLDNIINQWISYYPTENIFIADKVKSILVSQFNNLPVNVRNVLNTAVIIGDRFLKCQLERILEKECNDELHELVKAGILIMPFGSLQTWRFRHRLFLEVIYRALLPSEVIRLHTQVVDLIETGVHEFDGMSSEVISWHYIKSGQYIKSIPYLQAASIASIEACDYSIALEHQRNTM